MNERIQIYLQFQLEVAVTLFGFCQAALSYNVWCPHLEYDHLRI